MLSDENEQRFREILSNYTMEIEKPDFGDIWGGQIILICNDPVISAGVKEVVAKVGGRISEPWPMGFDQNEFAKMSNVAAVILHVANWSDETQAALATTEFYCRMSNKPLILRLNLEYLDQVFGTVTYTNVEHLLNDDPAELLIALESRTRILPNAIYSNRDEMDVPDLQKISADVERIAKALLQLSGPDSYSDTRRLISGPMEPQVDSSMVSDKPVKFSAEDQLVARPYGSGSALEADHRSIDGRTSAGADQGAADAGSIF